MTAVAFLWHMHQPYYEDLVTREHILPWVRLHALKDYYGMVALLREFPEIRATFNLVPSLLVQLEAFAADRARDRSLDLSLQPADSLDASDARFILDNFFHAQPQRMIEPYPRYAELFARRGSPASTFTVDELRDLQVWHKLARARAGDGRLLGAKPVGVWPSEGSVSNAMAALVARAGFQWMATYELILARTLGVTFTRDGFGRVEQPERLYAPYRLTIGES